MSSSIPRRRSDRTIGSVAISHSLPAMRSEPVVLVHGLASSFAHGWQEAGWADLLQDGGREVIGVDLLGHGTAPKPTDPEAYADFGGRVRDALPDAPVDAIGFSAGAIVLLELAAEDPSRFGRLVLIGVGQNVFRNDDHEVLARAFEGASSADGADIG